MTDIFNSNFESIKESNADLDLREIIYFFFRNKYFIILFSIFALFFAHLYSKTITRVWEGKFQIVLDSAPSNSPLGSNLSEALGTFAVNSSSDLQTQVGILKSQSVLMPVFEFVKNEKGKKSISYVGKSFSSWSSDALNVKLENRTSILEISYKDTDKSLIIPVLNKISEAYQTYSGKNNRRNLQLLNDYLNEQIAFYRTKSNKSLKEAQNFAVDQDLILSDLDQKYAASPDIPLGQNLSQTSGLIKNIDIENIRIKAANEIRNIDQQIKKINALKDDDTVPYLMLNSDKKLMKVTEKINEIDLFILDLKSKFRSNDQYIEKFNIKRKLLIKEQKKNLLNYLKARRIETEAKRDSAIRPKGVILKYKELMRVADRDESTLVSLENDLRKYALQQAKFQDPWELITIPTLSDYPTHPNTTSIRVKGLIFGFIGSLIIAYIREKRKNLVYSLLDLEKILGGNFTRNFKCNSILPNENIFLSEFLKINKNLELYNYDVDKENILKFKNFLELSNSESKLVKNLGEINQNVIYILISDSLRMQKSELIEFKEILSLKNIGVGGIIILSE